MKLTTKVNSAGNIKTGTHCPTVPLTELILPVAELTSQPIFPTKESGRWAACLLSLKGGRGPDESSRRKGGAVIGMNFRSDGADHLDPVPVVVVLAV